jgi:hypothetical protein
MSPIPQLALFFLFHHSISYFCLRLLVISIPPFYFPHFLPIPNTYFFRITLSFFSFGCLVSRCAGPHRHRTADSAAWVSNPHLPSMKKQSNFHSRSRETFCRYIACASSLRECVATSLCPNTKRAAPTHFRQPTRTVSTSVDDSGPSPPPVHLTEQLPPFDLCRSFAFQ